MLCASRPTIVHATREAYGSMKLSNVSLHCAEQMKTEKWGEIVERREECDGGRKRRD